MNQGPLKLLVKMTLAVLSVSWFVAPVRADEGLKTINVSGGGQVIYGPLTGETSLQGAMASMLRNIHGHFGDRPQVGKYFRTSDRDSIATFFTLTARNQGGRKLAGMVIVSMPQGSKPAAAVLYSDANQFSRQENVMLGKLDEAMKADRARPAGGQRSTTSHGAAGPVQPLRQTGFPDNSGSIGLPAGWQIANAGSGAVHVAGPHGEEIFLGSMFQGIYDPRNPQTRGLLAYLDKARSPYYVYPYGDDLVKSWLAILQQAHRRDHTPVPTFRMTSRQRAQASPYETAALLVQGDFDAQNGKGPLVSSVRLGSLKPTAGPQWALTISRESLPPQLVDEEWPTVVAMVKSYRQNGAEIQRQADVIIQNIHATAAANTARAQAVSEANDRHNADVEARWDDNAKYNKSFENYQLDRTVIQDNETGGHGTTGYQLGDALVKNNPNRFQYVPTQDFMRGVDY